MEKKRDLSADLDKLYTHFASKRNYIWCEVACSRCGVISPKSGYYSPIRIEQLKEDTKDWGASDDGEVLCPKCKKKEENKNEETN